MSNFQRSLIVIFGESIELFCRCGHREAYVDGDEGYKYLYGETLACNQCGNTEHFRVATNSYNRSFHSVEIYENGDKLSLVGKVGAYFWNQMIDKPTYTDQSFRITLNTTTGHLYLVRGKQVRNITYGAVTESFHRLFSEVETLHSEKVREFVRIALSKRGVTYRKVEDFIETSPFDKECSWIHFWDAMIYARFPQLQNIPLNNIKYIPDYLRKSLDNETTKTGIYRLLFGTNAKTVLRKMEKAEDYYTLHVLSRAIEKPENLLRMLELSITRTVKEWQFDDPFSDFDAGNETSEERTEYIRISKPGNNIFASYDFNDGATQEMIKTMKLFTSIYKETPFVSKLQREIQLEPYIKREQFLYSVLRDTYRMYTHIRSINPDYQVDWKRSFIKIHNILSKDMSRYKKDNESIPYKKEEYVLDKQYEQYSFKLAPDTDYLIHVGNELDICVGGYGEAAVKRQATISVLYKEEQPIACIEIDKKRVIRQAKLSHNRLPKTEEARMIRAWAKENKIIWNRCSDLKNAM